MLHEKSHLKCPIGHALDIPFENWTSGLRIYINKQCRDAAKIDKKRWATLTKVRRVARACQTSLRKQTTNRLYLPTTNEEISGVEDRAVSPPVDL
jgi:hypothetical protein